MAVSRPRAERDTTARSRTSRHIEALDALFAAVEADEQRGIDTARWLTRRLRQAFVDLDLYELAETVDAVYGAVTLTASAQQIVRLVELLEGSAEQHRR